MMIIAFIGFFIYEVFANWYIIERKKQYIDHARRAVIRTIFFLMISLIGSDSDFPRWLVLWASFHAMFWFAFDVALNLVRKRAWNYQGQTAWLDRITAKHANFFWVLKFFIMVAGIVTYVYSA